MSVKIIKSDEISNELIFDIINLIKKERKGINSIKRLHNFKYYRWKFKMNPCGAYVVVSYSNQDLMSFCSFTAKEKLINHSGLLYELGDIYVSSKVKGRGYLFRMLRKFHKEFPDVKVYGTPNDEALPSELKAGYKQINSNIKYRFMPIGLPIFHLLANKSPFAKLFYKIDDIIRIINNLFFVFINNIDCEIFSKITTIDAKFFSSDLFNKNNKYLLWRYVNSPEKYKYLVSKVSDDVLIYKYIIYKNIPFVFVVDHNINTSLRKAAMLKQLLKKEKIFGVFEMSGSKVSSFLNSLFVFKFKNIKFITYGNFIKEKQNFNNFRFLAGDTDNI